MNIPFIQFNKFGIMISSCLILVTLISLLLKGLNLGLDFTGGISLELKYEQKADLEKIRNMENQLLHRIILIRKQIVLLNCLHQ